MSYKNSVKHLTHVTRKTCNWGSNEFLCSRNGLFETGLCPEGVSLPGDGSADGILFFALMELVVKSKYVLQTLLERTVQSLQDKAAQDLLATLIRRRELRDGNHKPSRPGMFMQKRE